MFRQLDDGSFLSVRRSIIFISIVAIAVAYWELSFKIIGPFKPPDGHQEISHALLSWLLGVSISYLCVNFAFSFLQEREAIDTKFRERVSLTFKDSETAVLKLEEHNRMLGGLKTRLEELNFIFGAAPEILLFNHEKEKIKHDGRVEAYDRVLHQLSETKMQPGLEDSLRGHLLDEMPILSKELRKVIKKDFDELTESMDIPREYEDIWSKFLGRSDLVFEDMNKRLDRTSHDIQAFDKEMGEIIEISRKLRKDKSTIERVVQINFGFFGVAVPCLFSFAAIVMLTSWSGVEERFVRPWDNCDPKFWHCLE